MARLEKLLIAFYFVRYRYFSKFSSRRQLEQWQSRRVHRLAKWLKKHSRYYRERLADDPLQTPMIDKKLMMENFDHLNTKGLKKDVALKLAIACEQSRDFTPMIDGVTVGLSSGTSGSRGLFCAGFIERARYAGAILAKALPGTRGSQKVAFFLRANSNLYESVGSKKLMFRYFDLLAPLEDHAEELRRYQPTLLVAPASVLTRLAALLQGEIRPLHDLQRIYSVAEVLEERDQKRIEDVFGLAVHQIYQCTEGFLAISCREGHLHLNEDLVLIEKHWLDRKLKKFSPVITDFNRRTQPIFRYRLNDILTEDPRPCPCGSVMTRIRQIEGRCDDIVYFPKSTGDWLPVFPDFVRNAILHASDEIEDYRVIQEPQGRLRISLKGDDVAALAEKVSLHLDLLAKKLQTQLPEIVFNDEFPELNLKKLRRVSSQFLVNEQAAVFHDEFLASPVHETGVVR